MIAGQTVEFIDVTMPMPKISLRWALALTYTHTVPGGSVNRHNHNANGQCAFVISFFLTEKKSTPKNIFAKRDVNDSQACNQATIQPNGSPASQPDGEAYVWIEHEVHLAYSMYM